MKNNRFASILLVIFLVSLATTGTSAVGVVNKSPGQGNGLAQNPVAMTGQAASDASAAPLEIGAGIIDFTMTGDDLSRGLGRCERPATKSAFSPTDAAAWQWTLFSGVNVGDVVRWEFLQPDGSVYFASAPLRSNISGNVCFAGFILIAGQRAATLPGIWQVKTFYNDIRVGLTEFSIDGGGTSGTGTFCGNILAGGSPTGALQSFFNGALNLGFIFGGAGTCPPIVGLTRDRLFFARFGVEQVNSCLRFDTSRFTSLEARVPNLSGPQLEQEIARIITDLQLAVRQANLRCANLGPTAAESLFVAMVRLGSAAGRTVCFNCQPPSAGALAANRNDLAVAQQILQAYVACLPGYDLGIFNRVDPGNIFDLIALYTATNLAICNSSCCCICGG